MNRPPGKSAYMPRCSSLVTYPVPERGAFWALLRITCTSEFFAIPPRAPEVAVLSDQWNGKSSLSRLPVLQLARLMHSRWLAPLFGMGFYCTAISSQGSLRHILF